MERELIYVKNSYHLSSNIKITRIKVTVRNFGYIGNRG